MRIAQFTDSFTPIVDGVGRVVLNYANHLADRDNEVYVMAPMTNTGFRGGMKYEQVDFLSLTIKGQPYKFGVPVADTHFQFRLRQIPLDIIHVHSPFVAGQLAYTTAKRRGIPLVGTFHSKYKDDFKQALHLNAAAAVGTRMVVDLFDKCDEVWTVGEGTADVFRDYGYKGPLFVMPNGMDIRDQNPDNARLARETFSLGNERVLLYVGQINWKKNLELILKACADARAKGYEFTLVLAGQGPHMQEVGAKAKHLGISDKLVMTGHIMEDELLSGLYQLSELFLFPSLYDTAGLVTREAAVCGTPSVAVMGSCAAEPIINGENGLLCSNSSGSLSEAIRLALDHPEKMKEMGKKAMETIPIGWDEIISSVEERYKLLIDKKNFCKGR